MDSQSSKPSSSRRDRYRDKERKKSRDKDRDNYRSRNRDRDHDRGRNRPDRPRSTSPAEPSSKRQRTSASRKGKEPVRNGDRELVEVEVKVSEIGDDFIPLGVSDNEATPSEEKRRSEKTRQEEKGAEREWDRGKTTRRDRDEESPGTKRKYELVFDEEDDWAYRRSQRYERPVARMAPWVSQVDWDSCRNVGEM
jgi:non-canonical poly(A) RNA polymerase PAPD5/7